MKALKMAMNGNIWRRLAPASLHAIWIGALLLAPACGKFGSGGKVTLEQQTLSPRDRIEKMVRIRQEYGNNAEPNDFYNHKDVLISGRLVTEDHQPIPTPNTGIYASIASFSDFSYAGWTIKLKSDGSFSEKIPYGIVSLTAVIPGYMVYFSDQLKPNDRKEIQVGAIPLRRARQGALKITDPQGRPIPSVQFHGYFNTPGDSHSFLIGSTNAPCKLVANTQGVAVMDQGSTYSMNLEGVAPGFEKTKWETVQLTPGSTTTLVMKPARLSTGIIVDQQSKKPVAEARVYLIRAEGGIIDQHYRLEDAPLMATTGEDGRFTLDTLREDTVYAMLFDAKGCEPLLLRDISANQKDLHVELGPAIVIRGKVLGPEHAPRGQSGRYLTANQRLRFGNNSSYFDWNIPITEHDGVGTFEYSKLWQGSASIHGQEVKVAPPGAELTFDLRPLKPANTATTGTRQVIFRFETPQGAPPPQGNMEVSYTAPGRSGTQRSLKLVNGETSMSVPYQATVSGYMNHVVGYWVPDIYQIGVPEASIPLLVPIKTYPAGAIYGDVFEADGKPASGFRISINKKEFPQNVPEPDWNSMGRSYASTADTVNRFNASQLPLGGSYSLCVIRQYTYVASPTIRLTENQPLCKLTVRMPEGKTISGRVVDKTGRPLANITICLQIDAPMGGRGFGGVTTRPDGRFTFEHVNPDAPGNYNLYIYGKEWQDVQIPARLGTPMRDIVMEPGNTIKGVVIDAETGKPLSNIYVNATRTEKRRNLWGKEISHGFSKGAQTNAKGEFKVDSLKDDQYEISCQGCNMNKRVTVTAGEAAPLTLTVTMENYLKQERAREATW